MTVHGNGWARFRNLVLFITDGTVSVRRTDPQLIYIYTRVAAGPVTVHLALKGKNGKKGQRGKTENTWLHCSYRMVLFMGSVSVKNTCLYHVVRTNVIIEINF
jgi:hypothetical protein